MHYVDFKSLETALYEDLMEMAEWKEHQIFAALNQLGYDAALTALKQLIGTGNDEKRIDYDDIDDACFIADSYE